MKDNTLEFKKKEPREKFVDLKPVQSMEIVVSIKTYDADEMLVDEMTEGSVLTKDQLLALPQGPMSMIGQVLNYAINKVAQDTMAVLQRVFTVEELKLPPMPSQQNPVTGNIQGTDTVDKNGPLN